MPNSNGDDTLKLKWGDSFDLLSDERKQGLRARLNAWDPDTAPYDQPGPFAEERLSGLEVFWLAACWLAGANGDPASAAQSLTNWRSVAPHDHPESADVPEHSVLSEAFRARLPLARADLSGAHLAGAYLPGTELTAANLRGVCLIGACLCKASLMRAQLTQARLQETDLREAHLEGAYLSDTHLSGADLSSANLWRANLSATNLRDARLTAAYMRGTCLREAILSGAHLNGADMQEADLMEARLQDADLSGSDLSATRLVTTDLSYANLSGSRVYGASIWHVTLDGALQTDLHITLRDAPDITVDNLEVAQFLSLMLHNETLRQSIRVHATSSRIVLLLGRFASDRQRTLNALRSELRQRGYLPLVRDYDQPSVHDLSDSLLTLARMARFAIVDLTDARSLHREWAVLLSDVPPVVIQPIIQAHGEDDREDETDSVRTSPDAFSEGVAISEPWPVLPSTLPIYRYKHLGVLLAALNERVIAPAEQRVHDTAPRA